MHANAAVTASHACDLRALSLLPSQRCVKTASRSGKCYRRHKLFAIPWHALTLDTENKCFRLDVPKERLKEAPGFDKDDWPTMADQRWAQEVHSFYNARPYWY